MIKFDDVCREVGYDRNRERPEPVYEYYGYKGGEARCFETKKEALAFSKNVETVVKNKADIDRVNIEQRELERKASVRWREYLREEYSDLSDAQFGVVYAKAWDRCHSAGHDEVYYYFDELVDFCQAFANA